MITQYLEDFPEVRGTLSSLLPMKGSWLAGLEVRWGVTGTILEGCPGRWWVLVGEIRSESL